jgi:hypothetical protein
MKMGFVLNSLTLTIFRNNQISVVISQDVFNTGKIEENSNQELLNLQFGWKGAKKNEKKIFF